MKNTAGYFSPGGRFVPKNGQKKEKRKRMYAPHGKPGEYINNI